MVLRVVERWLLRLRRATSAGRRADRARVESHTYDANAAGAFHAASRVHDAQSSEGLSSQRSAQRCLACFGWRSSANAVVNAMHHLSRVHLRCPTIAPSDRIRCANYVPHARTHARRKESRAQPLCTFGASYNPHPFMGSEYAQMVTSIQANNARHHPCTCVLEPFGPALRQTKRSARSPEPLRSGGERGMGEVGYGGS